MHKVANFLSLVRVIIRTIIKFKQQKNRVKKLLDPVITRFQQKDDGSISSYDYYKISHYYGVGVPVLAGGIFETVFNKKLSSTELNAMTYMAAVTGLFDDFFDKTNHTKDELLSMISSPENHNGKNIRERVFIFFTLEAIENISNHERLDNSKVNVLEVQWESKIQTEQGKLSWDELKDLSMRKGGLSLLFYTSSINNDLSLIMTELLMEIGGLLQYGNDIFDVHKDLNEGVYTHVNTVSDMTIVKKDFDKTLENLFVSIDEAGMSSFQTKALKEEVLIFSCRAMVCLDQYLALQSSTKNKFSLKSYGRKQLTCDMEKPSNILKTINYYLKLL
ncbi:MAG: hypothetical protein ACJA0Q_000365 [Saprospiraceae bacterium]|jgi:hypothetical protein